METNSLQSFQRQLAHYLKDPHHRSRPKGINARGARVYAELVFNNLTGFLDACFPVCRSILGEHRWRRLNRSFFRDWPLQTPWFREIPQEFVAYLAEKHSPLALPRYLYELAHYEWMELVLDTWEAPIPPHNPQGSLLNQVVFNPAHRLLHYQWPVPLIGVSFRPRRPNPVDLVMYRDHECKVRFVQLTPLTARLLRLLSEEQCSGVQALQQLSDELQQPNVDQLQAFGLELLNRLRQQGLILGSAAYENL